MWGKDQLFKLKLFKVKVDTKHDKTTGMLRTTIPKLQSISGFMDIQLLFSFNLVPFLRATSLADL